MIDLKEEYIDTATYGPSEVCAVAGIAPATFNSWMARRYMRIASRGMGKPRKFSFTDVVRIATIAELGRHGFLIGDASDAIYQARDTFDLAVIEVLANEARIIVIRKVGDYFSVVASPRDGISTVLDPPLPSRGNSLVPMPGTEKAWAVAHTILDLTRIVKDVHLKLNAEPHAT